MEEMISNDGEEAYKLPTKKHFPYSDAIARAIIDQPEHQAIRDRIYTLSTVQRMKSLDIARAINGDLGLRPGNGLETAAAIVRRICKEIIPDETRRKINAVLHAKVICAHMNTVQEAKRKWMREQNMFVWTPEYLEYFQELLKSDDFRRKEWRGTTSRLKKTEGTRQRPLHYNHDAIAEALNMRFGTTEFTSERTRRKLERIREEEKAKKTQEDANGTAGEITPKKHSFIEMLDGTELAHFVHSLCWDINLEIVRDINIHELHRGIALIAPHIEKKDWENLIEIIPHCIRTFSRPMQQFLYYALAFAELQIDDTSAASKSLEFGVRAGGSLSETLNEKLQALTRQEPTPVGKIAKSKKVIMQTVKWRKK